MVGGRPWATRVGGCGGAWLSVVVASLIAAAELALSGTAPWGLVLPEMGVVHMLIGLGEGLITVGVLAFLQVARPDLLTMRETAQQA